MEVEYSWKPLGHEIFSMQRQLHFEKDTTGQCFSYRTKRMGEDFIVAGEIRCTETNMG